MKKTKLIIIFFLVTASINSGFSQQRGAFTDVYIKRILFPDMPGQVKTFIDSQGVFLSVKRVLYQTFDVNGFPSNGTSFTYIEGFTGTDTVKATITPAKSGRILTLTNKLTYKSGADDFSREVIEYNDLNKAIKVNIDTSVGGVNYGTKYQYTYGYDNSGRVVQADQYNRKSTGLYLAQSTVLSYNAFNKPGSLVTTNYEIDGSLTSKQAGKFSYQNEKLDSLVVRNMNTNSITGKFIPYYINNNIYKTDTYQNVFGDLDYTGSTWYYDYNVLSVEENEVYQNMNIVNPVQQNLTFINTPTTQFELIDHTGNKVATGVTNESTDVSFLASGFYVIRLKGTYNVYTKKLIKE